jgi:hypothetical protein
MFFSWARRFARKSFFSNSALFCTLKLKGHNAGQYFRNIMYIQIIKIRMVAEYTPGYT